MCYYKIKYREWIGGTDELLKCLYNKPETAYVAAVSSLLIGAIDGVVIQLLLNACPASIEELSKVYKLLLEEGIPDFLDKVKKWRMNVDKLFCVYLITKIEGSI